MTGLIDDTPLSGKPAALISHLAARGISVGLEHDQLRVTAAKGNLTDRVRDHLAAHKTAVLGYLKQLEKARVPIVPNLVRPSLVPLSFAQQRLWFLDQLTGGGSTYNISSALEIEGPLIVGALEAALNALIARHEVLRTTFVAEQGVPYQRIAPQVLISLPVVDLTHLTGPALADAKDGALTACLEDGFDLARDPMIKATLLRLGDETWLLILLLHHIAGDGWSIGILTQDLATLYDQMLACRAPDLPPLPLQYADFALWQREVLSGLALDAQLDFWRHQLHDAPPLLQLPMDRPRPDVQSFAGAHAVYSLPSGLTRAVQDLARRLETTLYSVLMAGFGTLLFRYSGQDDLVIGSPIANRNRREIEPIVGFFVNTLALRLQGLSDDLPFATVVARQSAVAREAFDHQDIPFERVVDDLSPGRDQGFAPIFQTAFALQNAPRGRMALGELTVRPVTLDNRTSKFDIFLSIEERDDALVCTWEYATDLFDAKTIARMADHYHRLLEGAADAPECGIGALPMLSRAEVDHQLQVLNAPFAPADAVSSFPDLFRDVVARHADAPALEFKGVKLSYAALDQASDRIAGRLIAAGLGSQDAVGILLPRGFDMIIAMLGILKAGGAFVPLDPAYPADRLAYIARDSGMRLVLSDVGTRGRLPAEGQTFLDMDGTGPFGRFLRLQHGPADLAYIIYTSGSTGRPKGAENTHAGLGNLAQVVRQIFGAGPGDRALHFASFSFDSSLWEILIPLATGATLCLIPEEMRLPDRVFADWLHSARITHATFTPSFLAALPHCDLPRLRDLVLAGEACPPALLRGWARGRRIINAYGPSEAAVCATFAVLDPDDPVTIGRPVPNVQTHILRGVNLLPMGAEGELVIGGLSVGRGYRGRSELTAAAFGPNPFGPGHIYRTGDKVRYLPDGRIEYVGRIDHQTKIRGHRIDPGEIEAVLSDDPAVQNAVVLAREDRPGDRRLVAYIQPYPPDEDATLDRTTEWQNLFDTVYTPQDAAAKPGFDIVGWTSSYDGKPLPAAEMRAWLADTLAVIRAHAPDRVLEIGCGSGLILSQIAPEVRVYDATDISAQAVAEIERLCAGDPTLGHVRVTRQEATDASGLTLGGYDLIILNSVVQYFPSLAYLRRVIAGLAPMLSPGGVIFLGDVCNLRLAGALHAAIEAFRAPPHRRRAGLAARVAQKVRDDEELFLDPAVFAQIAVTTPGLTSAQVFLKGGRYRNELSAFRYQVILGNGALAVPPLVIDGIGFGLAELAEHLPTDGSVLVTGLSNMRTAREAALLGWLAEDHDDPVSLWQSRAAPTDIEPEDVLDLVQGQGLNIRLLPGDTPGEMQALIYRGATPPGVAMIWHGPLANTPLFGKYRRMLVDGLRTRLRNSLPDYMMPAAFVVLERLPLTPNGKIDRRALAAPDAPLPDSSLSTTAPQTGAEVALVQIWCQVLRLDSVGLDDNFFEVGGDSISSVQVIARARDVGLVLSPQDIFKHQTIATLARAAQTGAGAGPATQGRAAGRVPATPIQRWFANTITSEPHHFNQSISVALARDCRAEIVAAAVDALHQMHDALTARFVQAQGEWVMEYGLIPAPTLRVVSCDKAGRISEICAQAQASLDPSAGRMSCPILFDRGEAGLLLFWTVHHLVVDVVSWHILQADFIRACAQLAEGQPVALGPRATSFADWAKESSAVAGTWAVRRHLSFWQAVIATPPAILPADLSGPDLVADAQTERLVLDADITARLLTTANTAYGTRPHELITAALAAALADTSGLAPFRFDVEGQGRDGGADLSRTVGWFTALYPIAVTPVPLMDLIPAIKDMLRAIPGTGQSFGHLRDLPGIDGLNGPPSQIVFNHLGQIGLSDAPPWPVAGPGPLDTGPIHAPSQPRPYPVQISTAIEGGELSLAISYGSQRYRQVTISRLAEAVIRKLCLIVAHCDTVPVRIATLQDYPLASLTAADLVRLPHGPEIEDILDATPMQEGMLFECLSAPDAGQYIEQVGFDLSGPLDVAAMERAWNRLVTRHTILRCGFAIEGQSRARQIVWRKASLSLVLTDLQHLSPEACAHHLASLRATDRARGFDFTAPPLMRLQVVRLGPDWWHLLWTSHHILMDGWCIGTVFRELRQLYAAERAGQPDPLLPAPDWRDYLRYRQDLDQPAAEAHWRDLLAGLEGPTRLCVYGPSGARHCDHLRLDIDEQTTAALQAAARAHRVTLNTLLQGAWSALLAHATGQNDVVHGTTINGRPPQIAGVENIVGLFINTVLQRTRMDWDRPLADWLRDRHAEAAALDTYGHVALRDLRGWCDVPRSDGDLFDTLFVFENFPFDEGIAQSPLADDLVLNGVQTGGETDFPLTAVASLRGQGLSLRLTYDTAGFDATKIKALARTYQTLLEGLTHDLSRPLRDWLPCKARADQVCPPDVLLVIKAVAQRLQDAPNAVVVTEGTQRVTAAQLDAQARALAGALFAAGHGAGSPVGLILDRGVDFVAALLGAWKRGAPFVPVDPAWPPARQAQVMALAGARVAISSGAVPQGVTVIPPDAIGPDGPEVSVGAEDLAYIIFTSGSAGVPKGVRISHTNLAAYVAGISDRLALVPGLIYATTSGFAADLGYTALFPALACKGQLRILSEAMVTDADAFAAHLRADPVDVLKTVPGHFRALLGAADAGAVVPHQRLIFGGDRLDADLVQQVRLLAPEVQIFNHYGPTETTIGAVCGLVPQSVSGFADLGQPLPGVGMTIRGPAGHLLPPGLTGEIWIGGASVSPGYIGAEGQDFAELPDGVGRIYRTGDLGHIDAAGRVHFGGRRDQQGKIRGFRVDPAEVIQCLRGHPDITDCHAAIRPRPDGMAELLAWVVGPVAGMRDRVAAHLPDAFVPAQVIAVSSIPRLANGKIDARALPGPEQAPSMIRPPATVTEALLCKIFADVLRRPNVHPDDNFFDLGGDSIISIQIVARAREAGIRLTTRDVFSHQTPAELAFCVRALSEPVPQNTPSGPILPAPIQARFLRQALAEPWHYNQALLFKAPSRDRETLALALAAIIVHHDMLRLRLKDGMLTIAEPSTNPFPVGDIDLTAIPEDAEAAAFAHHANRLQASLDLNDGPILCLSLVRRGRGKAPLIFWIIHHLAVDGVSWRILLDCLATACLQIASGQVLQLGPKTLSFALWTRHLSAPDRFAAELAHWRRASALVTDLASVPGSDLMADVCRSEAILPAADTAALTASLSKAPVLDLLVTALARALRAITGQRDLRIDLEGHGRDTPDSEIDISRTVGWFTALYPLRLTFPMGASDDPAQDLQTVRQALRQTPNGGLGFGVLREIALEPELLGAPEAAIVLNYLGQINSDGADHGLTAGPARSPKMTRSYPIEIVAMLSDGCLRLLIEHSPNRYRPAQIDDLLDRMTTELRRMSAFGADMATGFGTQDFGRASLSEDDFTRLQELLGDQGDRL